MEENVEYRDQTELVWAQPAYFTSMDTWLHSNNVLFYFAESPFFDRSSENNTLTLQYAGSEQEGEILATRSRFEAILKTRPGLSYVVAHDPLLPAKQIEAPDGTKLPANVWIIRKQFRRVAGDDSSVDVLRYYYISNQVIYEAPSVAKVLSNRMLNITESIGKIFSEASQYPMFSAAHGHTYTKPVQKSITQKEPGLSQQSKESTPMPGQEGPGAEKVVDIRGTVKEQRDVGSNTLSQALQMTMRYGKEYSDEVPLVGEPGNFRFSKKTEQLSKAAGAPRGFSPPGSGSRAGTPAFSRATSTATGAR